MTRSWSRDVGALKSSSSSRRRERRMSLGCSTCSRGLRQGSLCHSSPGWRVCRTKQLAAMETLRISHPCASGGAGLLQLPRQSQQLKRQVQQAVQVIPQRRQQEEREWRQPGQAAVKLRAGTRNP
jgi:hypothetical protein